MRSKRVARTHMHTQCWPRPTSQSTRDGCIARYGSHQHHFQNAAAASAAATMSRHPPLHTTSAYIGPAGVRAVAVAGRGHCKLAVRDKLSGEPLPAAQAQAHNTDRNGVTQYKSNAATSRRRKTTTSYLSIRAHTRNACSSSTHALTRSALTQRALVRIFTHMSCRVNSRSCP